MVWRVVTAFGAFGLSGGLPWDEYFDSLLNSLRLVVRKFDASSEKGIGLN